MKKVVKAGRLANGAEKGKGTIVHWVQNYNSYFGPALCGASPAIQWITCEPSIEITCKKCKKFHVEAME